MQISQGFAAVELFGGRAANSDQRDNWIAEASIVRGCKECINENATLLCFMYKELSVSVGGFREEELKRPSR